MWSATFLLLLNFISNDSEGLELRLSGHEVAIDVLPIVSEYSICRGYHIRQQKTALKFTVLMYGFDSCEDKASKPPLKADNLDDEEQSKVLALANYFGIYHAPNKLGLRFSLKFAQLKEKINWFVDNKGSETVVLVERSFNRDIVRLLSSLCIKVARRILHFYSIFYHKQMRSLKLSCILKILLPSNSMISNFFLYFFNQTTFDNVIT